ncbi:MAG: hypothetical protein ACREIA_04225 [Opitutaceae bacterium]
MRGITLTLSIFAILSAAVSGLLYALIDDRKASLEAEVATLHTTLGQTETRLRETTNERESLSVKAAGLERQLDELRARNVSLEARNSQLARNTTQLREEIALRDSTDRAAGQEAADLRRELVETKSALAAANAIASSEAIAEYESRIADLEGEVAYLSRHSRGRSFADALARVPNTLEGTVLEVGPDSAFVVLNIGSRNGAVPSLEMTLRRGSTIVARVRLTDVRDSYSVADVLPSSGSGNIRAGDVATRS